MPFPSPLAICTYVHQTTTYLVIDISPAISSPICYYHLELVRMILPIETAQAELFYIGNQRFDEVQSIPHQHVQEWYDHFPHHISRNSRQGKRPARVLILGWKKIELHFLWHVLIEIDNVNHISF